MNTEKIEKRKCSRCKKNKELTEFDEGRAVCKVCILDKRAYRQIKIHCPICDCEITRHGLNIHLRSQKHIKNQKDMPLWNINDLKTTQTQTNSEAGYAKLYAIMHS